MVARAPQSATWNREDRDLLIELRTEMGSMRTDVAGVRSDIKEVSTGLAQRVLNLEANAVNHIELEALDTRVVSLEETRSEQRGQLKTVGVLWAIATFVIPLLISYYVSQ